jgi:hypothetical protein
MLTAALTTSTWRTSVDSRGTVDSQASGDNVTCVPRRAARQRLPLYKAVFQQQRTQRSDATRPLLSAPGSRFASDAILERGMDERGGDNSRTGMTARIVKPTVSVFMGTVDAHREKSATVRENARTTSAGSIWRRASGSAA